jgi:hypothetical protein
LSLLPHAAATRAVTVSVKRRSRCPKVPIP